MTGYTIMVCLAFAVSTQMAMAQNANTEDKGRVIDRFALKTNAFEWLLTVPNIQVAYELSPSKYNRSVILLEAKYNWNTYHQHSPYFVFNVLDIRPEYRYYYRGAKRPWRACYIGGYGDFSSYSLKPGPIGRQGIQGGVGASWGYEIPLYKYKRCAIDFELGFSAGVSIASDKAFRLNTVTESYTSVPDKNRKIAVWPALTELRAVFSLRSISISEKFTHVKDKGGQEDPFKLFWDDINEFSNDASLAQFQETDEYKANAAKYESVPIAYRQDYFAYVHEAFQDKANFINGHPTADAKLKEKGMKHLRNLEKKLYRAFESEQKSLNSKAKKAKADKQQQDKTQ